MSEEFSLEDDTFSAYEGTFRILCLSGGGYRGLYSASVLEALEERAGRPLGEVFDLIAGTSIGGILAIGLAAGIPASNLRAAFEEHGGRIFPRRVRLNAHISVRRIGWGLFRRRYDAAGLERVVREILALAPGKVRLSDLNTSIIVPSVDATTDSPRIFTRDDADILLVDAALATSAAPGYFAEHRIDRSVFVDGGLIANAPDTIAIEHALRNGQASSQLLVLSVGTLGGVVGGVPRRPSPAGVVLRAAKLFELTLSAQQKLSVATARDLLGERYLRIDVSPSPEQAKAIGLDRTGRAARDTLRLLAETSIRETDQRHPSRLRRILR